MSTQALNGSGVGELGVDPIEQHIVDLEAMLPELVARRAQIEAQLREVTEREDRIKQGVAVLRGKAKPAASPAKPKGALAGRPQNPPSQKLLDDVYAIVARASEPISVNEIEELCDVTRSAVDNAVRSLRRDERIRIAGNRGVAKLYAVMP